MIRTGWLAGGCGWFLAAMGAFCVLAGCQPAARENLNHGMADRTRARGEQLVSAPAEQPTRAPITSVAFQPAGDAKPGPKPSAKPKSRPAVPAKLAARKPWTTSRVHGSPEPPPPFKTENAFPKLSFKEPTVLTGAPGVDRLFVVEKGGRIWSFPNDSQCESADLMIDLRADYDKLIPNPKARGLGDLYGLAFHPNYPQTPYCYVCYTLPGNSPQRQLPDGTRVVRYTVTRFDPPVADPSSEQIVITWLGGGHNGGCLKFGHDGCLYISTGDGSFTNPPDALLSGQDMGSLNSKILRINIDRPSEDRPYSIPADNPFVGLPGARGEVWAYGLRNPWKMSFDRKTGDLWVGDVGWERWELVQLVRRGGNYGWSIMEGRQPVRTEAKRGPTPIQPPTIDLPHADAASVTGGFVYRGRRLPELDGAYIYGDWETRRQWASWHDGERITRTVEIVEPMVRVVGYGEDNAGELYVLDWDAGTIHRFAKNDAPQAAADFPRRLSETGLFANVAEQTPAAGVVEFQINAAQWLDGLTGRQFIAVPNQERVTIHARPHSVEGSMFSRRKDFPPETVLVKNLALPTGADAELSERLIETQILHYDGRRWRGYTYAWNEQQTDAELVPAGGEERTLTIADPAAPQGRRETKYLFMSRAQCVICHNHWNEFALGFNLPQLDRPSSLRPGLSYSEDSIDGLSGQLRDLLELGVIEPPSKLDEAAQLIVEPLPRDRPLVDPYDQAADLERRARSYLHVNCAHCHLKGGGGSADIELRYTFPLEETKLVDVAPLQGTFGIAESSIVTPGDPYRSVLLYRISKLGRGRMPHLGSEEVDPRGVALVHDWIRQLPLYTDAQAKLRELAKLDEPAILQAEAMQQEGRRQKLAFAVAAEAGRKEITAEELTDADKAEAARRDEELTQQRAESRDARRVTLVNELLGTTPHAMLLLREMDQQRLPAAVQQQIVSLAAARPEPQVRDLFERFVPPAERVARLGNVVDVEALLAMAGDREAGAELFLRTEGVACRNCHRLGGAGRSVGPDLDDVGRRLGKAALLESILEPSRKIDPKFQSYLLETVDGKLHTGLLIERSDKEVHLRAADGKEIRVPAADVEALLAQPRSLMPELMHRDMTAQQLADLLAFLSAQQAKTGEQTPEKKIGEQE